MERRDFDYDEVISKDNLMLAWDHVRYDANDDYSPDVFGYDDVGANINDLIKTIHETLASDDYQASPLKHVEIPKNILTVRPGSVPEIKDRIVSYAILNIITPKIDQKLSDSVYSYRVKKNYEKSKSGLFDKRREIPFLKNRTLKKVAIIEEWTYGWVEFYKISKQLYQEEGYSFLSVSDISAYFENINHELLRDHLLLLLPNEQKTVNLLMEILGRWVWKSGTMRRLGRGIPQRNDVSSFLGNIFLMPLDDVLEEYSKSHDIKYIRYMDDVKVFSKSLDTAQEVLLLMNKTLRDWYLNIQGSKTELLDGEKIGKKIFPPGMDELNVTIEKINEEVQKGKISPAQRKDFEQELKKYLQKISKKRNWGKHDWSLFSRLLTGFRIIESPQLVGKCLKVIEKTPDERINTKIMNIFVFFPAIRG